MPGRGLWASGLEAEPAGSQEPLTTELPQTADSQTGSSCFISGSGPGAGHGPAIGQGVREPPRPSFPGLPAALRRQEVGEGASQGALDPIINRAAHRHQPAQAAS